MEKSQAGSETEMCCLVTFHSCREKRPLNNNILINAFPSGSPTASCAVWGGHWVDIEWVCMAGGGGGGGWSPGSSWSTFQSLHPLCGGQTLRPSWSYITKAGWARELLTGNYHHTRFDFSIYVTQTPASQSTTKQFIQPFHTLSISSTIQTTLHSTIHSVSELAACQHEHFVYTCILK